MSHKRHRSLQENWLALKSQISEVAKIVAALPTFRTQLNRVSLGWKEAPQVRTTLPHPCREDRGWRPVFSKEVTHRLPATLPPASLLLPGRWEGLEPFSTGWLPSPALEGGTPTCTDTGHQPQEVPVEAACALCCPSIGSRSPLPHALTSRLPLSLSLPTPASASPVSPPTPTCPAHTNIPSCKSFVAVTASVTSPGWGQRVPPVP